MGIPKPILPKEHGLWVWTLLPFCVGAGLASGDAGNFPAVFLVVFFWFMAATPARMIYKNSKKKIAQSGNVIAYCAVYSALGTAGVISAVISDYTIAPLFIPFAVAFYVSVRASYEGFQKGFLFEFGGIIFLTIGSFLGSYAVAGGFQTEHLAAWAFTFVFLMDRNSQTRYVVRTVIPYRGKIFPLGELKFVYRINLFISLVSIMAVSAILSRFMLHKAFIIPYLPGVFLTFYFLLRPPKTLRVVGYSELAIAVIYGVSIVAISRFLL